MKSCCVERSDKEEKTNHQLVHLLYLYPVQFVKALRIFAAHVYVCTNAISSEQKLSKGIHLL